MTVYWLQNKGGYAYSFMISYYNTGFVCELSAFVREGEKWSIRRVADDGIAIVPTVGGLWLFVLTVAAN